MPQLRGQPVGVGLLDESTSPGRLAVRVLRREEADAQQHTTANYEAEGVRCTFRDCMAHASSSPVNQGH